MSVYVCTHTYCAGFLPEPLQRAFFQTRDSPFLSQYGSVKTLKFNYTDYDKSPIMWNNLDNNIGQKTHLCLKKKLRNLLFRNKHKLNYELVQNLMV